MEESEVLGGLEGGEDGKKGRGWRERSRYSSSA